MVLQPKLLRVLQDQEFERLGSPHTLKVNFRLIAATHRDFLRELKRGNSAATYIPLNVFPVRVPALRERREDIHCWSSTSFAKCAKRMNKPSPASREDDGDFETMAMARKYPRTRELCGTIGDPDSRLVLQSPLKELESAGEQGFAGTLEEWTGTHCPRPSGESWEAWIEGSCGYPVAPLRRAMPQSFP